MVSLFEEKGGIYVLGVGGMYYPGLELPKVITPHLLSKYT